jgi:hypothetical protein
MPKFRTSEWKQLALFIIQAAGLIFIALGNVVVRDFYSPGNNSLAWWDIGVVSVASMGVAIWSQLASFVRSHINRLLKNSKRV